VDRGESMPLVSSLREEGPEPTAREGALKAVRGERSRLGLSGTKVRGDGP